MTEKKDTLSLDANEWRAMIAHNLQRGIEFVNTNGQITAEGIVAFNAHLDRIKVLVLAWHASAAPGQNAQQQAPVTDASAPQADGAAPKGKGGWPKGKSRKQKPEVAQVQ